MSDKYPLECIDLGPDHDDIRYLLADGSTEETEGAVRRRCRQLTGSELGDGCMFSMLAEWANEAADMGDFPSTDAWRDWEEPCVTVRPGAEEALREWADKYLEVKAWVCEGDE